MSGIQIADAIVRVQALDGVWETVGVDRLAGIVPENISCSSNEWGSEKASFDLRRDPGGIYPDLTAFTPVDIEVGGVKVWSGRVSSTPSREGSDSVVNVQCEGWQYHLDDDVYERRYAHTSLADYQDVRSWSGTSLGNFSAAGVVQSADQGSVVIGFGNAAPVVQNTSCAGVFLDLGVYTGVKRVVVSFTNSGIAAGYYNLTVKAADYPDGLVGYDTLINVDPASVASPQAATATTARRYVVIFLVRTGATGTETGDRLVKITASQVFASTAYESGNASILKATDVIGDALGRATMFLTDTSGVTATSFSIPDYSPEGLRTPREQIEAVNAYHAHRAQVTVDRRVIFQPQPSSPLFEAGEWSGCELSDASMNDGDEIYSRCIVEAAGPDGVQMRVERTQAQQAGTSLQAIASPAPDNPSFATNTTSWTASGSVITRDTVTFDSTPASGRWDNTGASDALGIGDSLATTFTGTFQAGIPYTLSMRLWVSALAVGQVNVRFGTASDRYEGLWSLSAATTWETITVSWTPSTTVVAPTTPVTLNLIENSGGRYFRVDSLQLFSAQPTLVDRRGFKRTKILPVQSALTTAAAQQIADTYLSLHRTTPYRGSITAAPGGIRSHQTGQPVHPATLLTQTQEKIRLTHRINPDDGSVGRDGTIAAVTYDHDAQTASIDLDNRTTNFEAFLSRLSLLTGQVR